MVSEGHHQRAALNSLKMMAQSILFLLEAGASVKPGFMGSVSVTTRRAR